jgi:hypothetical protein
MMSTSMRILAFAAVASLPVWAQQGAPSPQPQTGSVPLATSPQQTSPQQTSPQPGSSQGSGAEAVPVPSTANSPEAANPQLRPVSGELVTKLDTKSAKTGDSVIIKTTENATTANGIEIPKGSKIVGHITDVEAKGKSNDNSRVTIQLDQAQIKGGQSLPIRTVIQSVSPPGGSGASADSYSGGAPSATAPPSGGSTSGGGATAGSRSSQSASPGSPQAAPGASPQPSMSSPMSSAPVAGTVVAKNGNIAIRTTAIPGIFLAGNVNGQPFSNAAGALLGAKQDVHLEGGTVMVVAIAAAPSPVNER